MTIRHDYKVAVADGGWRMVDLGLTTGLDSGDITLFDRENDVIYALPAPSDRLPIRSWKDVRPEDVAVVDPEGNTLPGSLTEPTVELPMHLAIYAARPDVNAIVHTHAEDSQVFAAAERDIPTATIDSYTRVGFGPIRCGRFGVVASKALGDNMVEVLAGGSKAALMARHGAVALGPDLADALFTATVIEKAARQAMKVASLGATPEQLTLHHIFDGELARDIEAGRVHLDTQTVTIQRLA
ncbi:class II aldolase/adducin family protein [Mycolicibacterium houstonense]|uniref:class II aldolase/adducin family protein n=1 Tax=Mycolicibacterium houstonense TaxID=146021 RepID=UPI003F9BA8D9